MVNQKLLVQAHKLAKKLMDKAKDDLKKADALINKAAELKENIDNFERLKNLNI